MRIELSRVRTPEHEYSYASLTTLACSLSSALIYLHKAILPETSVRCSSTLVSDGPLEMDRFTNSFWQALRLLHNSAP